MRPMLDDLAQPQYPAIRRELPVRVELDRNPMQIGRQFQYPEFPVRIQDLVAARG